MDTTNSNLQRVIEEARRALLECEEEEEDEEVVKEDVKQERFSIKPLKQLNEEGMNEDEVLLRQAMSKA